MVTSLTYYSLYDNVYITFQVLTNSSIILASGCGKSRRRSLISRLPNHGYVALYMCYKMSAKQQRTLFDLNEHITKKSRIKDNMATVVMMLAEPAEAAAKAGLYECTRA